MFGIGSTELLVILVVALIVLGPKSLASVSRSLGKALGEFRRVSTDFQRTLNAESAEAERREQEAKRRREAPAEPAPTAGTSAPDTAQGQENEDALTPPEGSPLAEALAKARAEAEGAPTGTATGPQAAPEAGGATSPTPPHDGPRA